MTLTYKDTDKLTPDQIEAMWRAIDQIATALPNARPGHVAYKSKAELIDTACAALPTFNEGAA